VKLAPIRAALDFGPRPDPQRGIFETILVTDGQAPLLDAQLERLRESARELYGPALVDDELAERRLTPVRAGVPAGSGRLRVALEPRRGLVTEHGPRPADPSYTGLAPFVLPGGLGSHKWVDRRLVDGITAAAGQGALALIVDEDLAVLEATRMNVLIEEHGRLISPPSDGRFRPGFGRRRLRFAEQPVGLERLLAADAVVLTSALRVLRLPLVGGA
jgi:para-aminobenzoate synthetase/4-amino-4-deoxychorismate lyase